MACFVELFVYQLRVKPCNHDISVFFSERDTITLQFTVESSCPDKIYCFPRMILIQVKRSCHTGCKHVFFLAGKTEILQPDDIILSGTGGIISQIDITLPQSG